MKSNQGSFVKRVLMVGLLAGSSVLAVSSFAMPGAGSAGGCEAKMSAKMGTERGYKMSTKSAADWGAKRGAYLAGLKQKLNLQPEQEAAWNAFVDTAKGGVTQKMDRQALRKEMRQLTTPERLDKMQALAQQRQAKMQARGDAIKTFYAQLTPDQQSVFDSARLARGAYGQGHRHGHHRHGHGKGHGDGYGQRQS